MAAGAAADVGHVQTVHVAQQRRHLWLLEEDERVVLVVVDGCPTVVAFAIEKFHGPHSSGGPAKSAYRAVPIGGQAETGDNRSHDGDPTPTHASRDGRAELFAIGQVRRALAAAGNAGPIRRQPLPGAVPPLRQGAGPGGRVVAAVRAGAMVLDLPCGTGRFSKLVAECGHRLVRGDLSYQMVAHARELGPTITYWATYAAIWPLRRCAGERGYRAGLAAVPSLPHAGGSGTVLCQARRLTRHYVIISYYNRASITYWTKRILRKALFREPKGRGAIWTRELVNTAGRVGRHRCRCAIIAGGYRSTAPPASAYNHKANDAQCSIKSDLLDVAARFDHFSARVAGGAGGLRGPAPAGEYPPGALPVEFVPATTYSSCLVASVVMAANYVEDQPRFRVKDVLAELKAAGRDESKARDLKSYMEGKGLGVWTLTGQLDNHPPTGLGFWLRQERYPVVCVINRVGSSSDFNHAVVVIGMADDPPPNQPIGYTTWIRRLTARCTHAAWRASRRCRARCHHAMLLVTKEPVEPAVRPGEGDEIPPR